jgi:hypothetical protein
MAFKALLIVIVISILMEDGSTIQKSEEEKREEKELAELVNKTLAEEKKKEDEEKRREDKKKRKIEDKTKTEEEDQGKRMDVEDKDEACPPTNSSCPIVELCQPCEDCPGCPGERPCQECPPCEECGPCPEIRPCKPCRPCGPCPVVNSTMSDPPTTSACPEASGMSPAVAMAVGAIASLLVTGVATAIGLLLRYASPMLSGFIFLATIIIVWYLSSQYPETARELGSRTANLLREAAVALGHRVMAAVQRHQDQVSVPICLISSCFLI